MLFPIRLKIINKKFKMFFVYWIIISTNRKYKFSFLSITYDVFISNYNRNVFFCILFNIKTKEITSIAG